MYMYVNKCVYIYIHVRMLALFRCVYIYIYVHAFRVAVCGWGRPESGLEVISLVFATAAELRQPGRRPPLQGGLCSIT